MKEEISEFILEAVKKMNNYLKGIVVVEIIDTEMIRKYPDNYAKFGYLGVTILITCNNRSQEIFLKYQFAEDMCFYSSMIDGFMAKYVRDDLEKILLKYDRLEKLKKINETN